MRGYSRVIDSWNNETSIGNLSGVPAENLIGFGQHFLGEG